MNKKSGFTLLEILIVIAIIAILATIVLIAIDPAKRFREANNASRQAHIASIADAIGLRIVDERGTFFKAPSTTNKCSTNLPTHPTEPGIGDWPQDLANAKFIGSSAGEYDLAKCLTTKYLGSIPADPKGKDGGCTDPYWKDGSDYKACYRIYQDSATKLITIMAPNTEREAGATEPADFFVAR